MSPIAVFYRTLMKCSAIFLGAGVVFIHPSLDWSAGTARGVTAQSEPRQAAVDGLVAVLKDTDAGVRKQAAHALGQLGNAKAVPALIEALKDSDAEVRRGAMHALAEIGDARALPALTAALKDEDAGVRRQAVLAIAEIGDGEDNNHAWRIRGSFPRVNVHVNPRPRPNPRPVIAEVR